MGSTGGKGRIAILTQFLLGLTNKCTQLCSEFWQFLLDSVVEDLYTQVNYLAQFLTNQTWEPTLLSCLLRYFVPHLAAMLLYAGCWWKNSVSAWSASDMGLLVRISCWLRLTTPMKPSFSGYDRPISTSNAFVPASIRSSFVSTPIVLLPVD